MTSTDESHTGLSPSLVASPPTCRTLRGRSPPALCSCAGLTRGSGSVLVEGQQIADVEQIAVAPRGGLEADEVGGPYLFRYTTHMDPAHALRTARARAGLTQRELAHRAGTSQPTVAAYESGAKAPSVRTLDRLLGAAGARLTVAPGRRGPTDRELERAGRELAEVLALAEALPARHDAVLRYPRLGR